jgi:predicted RNA polymerase sigma factor
LAAMDSNPVIRLNFAVALAEAGGLDAALREIEAVRGALDDYQPFHAALADLLRQAGRLGEADEAYQRAIAMAGNEADARFLEKARVGLSQ